DDRHRCDPKTRQRIKREYKNRCETLTNCVPMRCREYAERNGERIGQDERNPTQLDGDRNALYEFVDDRPVISQGLTEIQSNDSLQPPDVLNMQRLIESIDRPCFIDDLRRKQLIPATLLFFELQRCRIARSEM